MAKWIVKTDGGCPSNPGPGSFAFVIVKEDGTKITRSGFLPSSTNNQAEYRAVTAAALFLAQQSDLPDNVEFWSDSQLVVRQLTGQYKVNFEMLPFYTEALDARQILNRRIKGKITNNWFPREENTEADELCNEVLRKRGIKLSSKKK